MRWYLERRIFFLTSSSIKSHQEVIALLKNRAEQLETFETYAPAHRFIEAIVSATDLSFSVKDEDGTIFAMALGVDPEILPADRVATTRGIAMDLVKYKHRADWDFYSIDTESFLGFDQVTESKDEVGIKELLEEHAPNSSVWPGNEEVIFWGELREGTLLVATGTLVRWRTGEVMFASIATHSDFRGKGLAQKLVKQMLSSAAHQGISHVGLGVFAGNIAAKKAYEKVGFKLIGEFSSYQLTTLG
jgi:ribosomal protein S18 acetylase RimI-like enzyme